ncbi:MAG: glycosyltransferase [Ktedonobacteraceae bacterium]
MRILFVTPYPPSRIRVRGYGFLKELHCKHEVTVLTQCSSEQELSDVEVLRNRGFQVIAVQESKRYAVLRSGRALFSNSPLQVAYARSALFAQAIHDVTTQYAFDVVHVEHLRGIASMEQLAHMHPLVWDAVDCISLLCKHTMVAGPNLKVRMVARLELERTQRYEARLLSQLRHVVVTSERDRQAMIVLHRKHTGDVHNSDDALDLKLSVLPNGVDLDYFHPMPPDRRRFNIVFSGKMSYHANVAAVLYLYQQIMPLIWRQIPEATLTVVGREPPKAIQLLGRDPRIEVTGYVEDLRPYIRRAEVMITPMVYSVGIQNKVLEAMALGTPTVVAAQVAEALDARPGRDLLVAENAAEFAQQTVRLMHDVELHARLSQCGRRYVEEKHNWGVITDRLIDLYQHAAVLHRGENATKVSDYSTSPHLI